MTIELVAGAHSSASQAASDSLGATDVAAYAWVGALVDELARGGVRDACVAPGSRSTALALTLAAHDAMRVWMQLDERSAAFFALGLARASGRPVALVCTSGTAAANFFPAVIEARLSRVPLVVLTADRPAELRADVGAPQTIDQRALYGSYPLWFVDAPLPEATPPLLRQARTLGARAVATALGTPRGPVHVNLPFREPLVPRPVPVPDHWTAEAREAWTGRPDGAPWVRIDAGLVAPSERTVCDLAALLADARRPVIVCGPHDDVAIAAPVGALARRLDAPVLADPLSSVRYGLPAGTPVIDAYDAVLRHDAAAASLAPDLVLRIGALPTSKPLQQWLQRHALATQILLGDGAWADPAQVAAWAVGADIAQSCVALEQATAELLDDTPAAEPAWSARWRRMNDRARDAITELLDGDDAPGEPRLFAELAARLPAGTTLWVSSSMPVRDLDSFGAARTAPLRVLANRGANGIDGVISSALGAAAANDGPTVLAIGDLAFYHDMNGLLAARLHDLDATIVLVNNDGGGIFSFLPQHDPALVSRRDFELLFGTPHGLDFANTAALYGARLARPQSWSAFAETLQAAVGRPGLDVIEVRTDRARNVAQHRDAWAAVVRAIAELS